MVRRFCASDRSGTPVGTPAWWLPAPQSDQRKLLSAPFVSHAGVDDGVQAEGAMPFFGRRPTILIPQKEEAQTEIE
jgi:hypothetical protein